MDRNYGGVIWTNHALEKLSERGITQEDAWYTFQHPQQSRYAQTRGAWIYYRTYDGELIEVVAKQNDRKEWIILSVWTKNKFTSRPKTDKSSNFMDNLLEFLLGRFRR